MDDDQEEPCRRRRDIFEEDNLPPEGFEHWRVRHQTNFMYRHDAMRGIYIRQMEMYLSLVEQLAKEAQVYTIVVLGYGMMAGLYA
jgi:hypothetical protein